MPESIICQVCNMPLMEDEEPQTDDNGTVACPDCSQERCQNCVHLVFAYDESGGIVLCESCIDERRECNYCSETCWLDDMYSQYGEMMCSGCWESRCVNCSYVLGDGDVPYWSNQHEPLCEDCYYDQNRDDQADDPEYQENFDYGIESFVPREFATVRGEQIVSYELEFGRDPEPLAESLFEAGLSRSPNMGSYTGGGGNKAVVKYDGSVDGGGELVGSKFALPNQGETSRFWRTFEVLRTAVKDGNNTLDMRCGLHIHIDARRMSLNQVMSIAVVSNYLEDILYRLASAHWRSHRSETGNDYAKPSPKEITSKSRMMHMFGDRYLGLNLGNYLSNRRECTCGVGYDRGDICTCDHFNKMTLEYRLFNTTANHVKMHAYVALVCAIAAYARDKELTASDLPAMEYTYSTACRTDDADKYIERLAWMFEQLPLSESERESIRYTIRNSSLNAILTDLENPKVKGILDEDTLLDIPRFVPVNQADQVTVDRVPFAPPPITEETRIGPYGGYVYLAPGIDEPCDRRQCNTCWVQYPREMVREYERSLVPMQEEIADRRFTWFTGSPLHSIHPMTLSTANAISYDAHCSCYECSPSEGCRCSDCEQMLREDRETHPLNSIQFVPSANDVFAQEYDDPGHDDYAFGDSILWVTPEPTPQVTPELIPSQRMWWYEGSCTCYMCISDAARRLNIDASLDYNGRWRNRAGVYTQNPFVDISATMRGGVRVYDFTA